MDYETILVEKHGGLGIITLNRPERLNALNATLLKEFDEAVVDCDNDDGVKVIIVTGAGKRAFSAGADIHEMNRQSEEQLKTRRRNSYEQHWRLASCRKPTIGAINGLAYGGGSVMSTLFDLRVGCENTSFRFLMVKFGRVGATWTLPLIVGWPVTKELLLTGRTVEADEALRIGLLNRLVPSGELMKTAIEMGQAIAANNTLTVQAIKDILVRNIGLGLQEMLSNELQTMEESLEIPPPGESFKDFLERKGG